MIPKRAIIIFFSLGERQEGKTRHLLKKNNTLCFKVCPFLFEAYPLMATKTVLIANKQAITIVETKRNFSIPRLER